MNTILPRRYKVSKTSLSHHYDVLLPDGRITYFAQISTSLPNMPALTLFTGMTMQSPIVATSYMPSGTGNIDIHLIDPVNRVTTQQEVLAKESVYASKYTFMATVPSLDRRNPEQPLRETRPFIWKRTHRVGVNGMKLQPLSSRNWKLVDQTTHELLAVFTSEWSFISCGALQINVD